MKNYKTSFTKGDMICLSISFISFIIAFIWLVLIIVRFLQFNNITISILVGLATILVVSLLIIVFLIFSINKELFISGKLSAGLGSLIFVAFIIYFTLFILWLAVPEWKENLSTVLTVVTTLLVSIVTIMGVRYTIAKQQNEKDERKNLIFALCEKKDVKQNYKVTNSFGNKNIQINLMNVSENFGYLVGIYRICGCDIHQVGDSLPYFPIQPHYGYSITNIRLNLGDDQLMIVYKDISENFYYLLLSANNQYIDFAGKCDMGFLEWRLSMTDKSEKKVRKIANQQFPETTNGNEEFINMQKEKTKPVNTKRENGFDLILSASGDTLTDVNLLNRLKKERAKLAKEKQIKPYMIFNNQQLVAMATYKPNDELSFIAIYGLGKKKYELYGEYFLSIIAGNSDVHESFKSKVA